MHPVDDLTKKIEVEMEVTDLKKLTNYHLLWLFQTNVVKYYQIEEFWGKGHLSKIEKFLTTLFRQRSQIEDEIIRRMKKT